MMTHIASRVALCSLVALSTGCGGAQQPETTAKLEKKEKALPASGAVTPPVADIRGDILGTLTVTDLDSLLRAGTGYVLPHLPPPFQGMVKPEAVRTQLFKALKAEALEAALDTTRPAVLGMADPEVFRGGDLGPLLAALPVKDGGVLVDFLGRNSDRHESTPWKDHLFKTSRGAVMLRLEGGFAFFASHEKLLHGASGALLPLLQRPSRGTALLEVRLETIYARYAKQLDLAVAGLQALVSQPEKGLSGLSGVMRRVERWLRLAKGVKSLDLALELEPSTIRFRLAAVSKGSGEFQTYLARLNVGEPWGAKYLPKDSILAVVSREDQESRLKNVEESFELLQSLLKEKVSDKILTHLRDAIRRTMKHFSGEAAGSVYVTGNGGVGALTVGRVKDAQAAQQEMGQLIKAVGRDLSEMVTKLIQSDLTKTGQKNLAGFGFSVKVRPGAAPVAGQKADVAEIVIRWPRPKDKEDRKKLEQAKKALAKVFGPRLEFAFLATGEALIWSLGQDCRKRLAEAVAVARGGAGSSMEKIMHQAAAGKKPVLVTYLPVATLAESVLRVVDRLTPIPADARELVHKILPGPGKEAPVVGLLYRDRDSLVLDLSLSPDLIGMAAKGAVHMILSKSGGAAAPSQAPRR